MISGEDIGFWTNASASPISYMLIILKLTRKDITTDIVFQIIFIVIFLHSVIYGPYRIIVDQILQKALEAD